MLRWINIAILLALVVACSQVDGDDIVAPRDVRAELNAFFPIETGFFRDYFTRTTTYFTASSIETREFLTREETGHAEPNQVGGMSRELRRYVREHEREEWILDSLWSVRYENSPMPRMVQVENGFPFIKLVVPMDLGISWDGNGLNGKNAEPYTYVEKLDRYEVNGEVFDDCIMVLHLEDDDQITVREIRFEVYARNRGMVHRYVAKLRYCSRPECLGQEIIEQGIIIEMTQVGYGIN